MNEKLKRSLLVVAIIASVIPSFLLIAWPSTVTVSTLSLWLADTLGYTGIVLMLWMYMLGAKSIMGIVFKDLAPVLSIHKWIGKYGVIAIFLHPLLVTFSFGESLFYSIVPHIGTLYERHVTLGRISFWLLVLTWIVSALIRDRIKFRPWKYLHYLAYICVPFAFLHVPDVGSHYMTSSAVKAYFFLLIFTFLVISIVRLRGILNLDKVIYTVVSHTRITDTDYVLNLKPVSQMHLTPQRGQYAYIKLGYISEDHPFSILQYDDKTNNLAIGYRIFGPYTKLLSELALGDKVYVGGPHGSFMSEYGRDARPTVFLAGGVGITPFVDHIIHNNGEHEQWLFAANRSRETALLTPEVKPYLGKRLINVYNRVDGALQPGEETGYITGDMLKKYLGELGRYSFYLCGPPPMMKAIRATLDSLGVEKDHIQSEKFGW